MPERWELRQLQSLPLAAKVSMTESRIREWVTEYGEAGHEGNRQYDNEFQGFCKHGVSFL